MDLSNLFKLLSLSPDEMNYFIGAVVGNADANPERPVGEVVAETFAELDSIRSGEVDPFAEIFDALFGPAPAVAPEQDAPEA